MTRYLPLLLLPLTLFAQGKEDPRFPAYRIIGNIYYVGESDITSYLITTPKGNILINPGFARTVPIIRQGIAKLGFRFEDIKIVLNGQAHEDHVGGAAEIKEATGAQIVVSEGDTAVMEGGGKGDFHFEGRMSWKPVKVDRQVKEGDTVELGGVTLVAHITPGHTKGCTTWTMIVADGGRKYNVVFVGGTSINPGVILTNEPKYPAIAADYAKTWKILHALPCDVFLGAHGVYYGMIAKYERLKNGDKPNPFIDPAGYKRFVAESEKEYLDQLAAERK